MIGPDGKPKVRYVRGSETDKEAAIRSVTKRHFEPPSFGPGGFHPNIFCLNVVAPH